MVSGVQKGETSGVHDWNTLFLSPDLDGWTLS